MIFNTQLKDKISPRIARKNENNSIDALDITCSDFEKEVQLFFKINGCAASISSFSLYTVYTSVG